MAGDKPENISSAVIPYFQDDDKRSKYLSFRVAGFNVRESMDLSTCSWRSVKRWREDDPEFGELDTTKLPELRKQLSAEYINIEFSRNFHLVLLKDFKILLKSMQGKELDTQEHSYLLKLRSHYTPQQLVLIKQLVGEVEAGEPFDYTKLVLTIRREREEITMKAEA